MLAVLGVRSRSSTRIWRAIAVRRPRGGSTGRDSANCGGSARRSARHHYRNHRVLRRGVLHGVSARLASLEGHAVVFQIISFAFMVPLGISQAATVRVGHAYGAGDGCGVSRSAGARWRSASASRFSPPRRCCCSPNFYLRLHRRRCARQRRNRRTRRRLSADRRAVPDFDGAQAVAAGMCAGVHDARTPMSSRCSAIGASACRSASALAFATPLAGTGLWIGLACGLAACRRCCMTAVALEGEGSFSSARPTDDD